HAWSRSLYGGSNFNPPSRFLGEIPAELVHSVEPERTAPRAGGGTYAGGDRRIAGPRPAAGAPGSGTVGSPPPPRAVGRTPPPPPSLVEGDTVYHDRYGEGVVVAVQRAGAMVTVHFREVGDKTLALEYAPLEKRPS